jgi:hypothetical protein
VIPPGQLHGPFVAEEEAVRLKYFSSVPVYILRDGTTFIYRADGTTISAGQLDFAKGSPRETSSRPELVVDSCIASSPRLRMPAVAQKAPR